MSSTGTTTLRSKVFAAGGCTIVTGWAPPRKRATSSGGRTVAERPMRWAGCASRASSRSRVSARCEPRFEPATACTSSMITVVTPSSVSRALAVSMRYRLSGVVIKMSGGDFCSARRSALGVSPLRTPTVMFGATPPNRSAVCVTPMSGERRLRSTSTPSALSGLMYSTRVRRRGSSGGGSAASRSIDHKNAASVLPEPVGATTSAWRPVEMASHAPSCAGVGAGNAPVNHSRVAGANLPSTALGSSSDIPLLCCRPLTARPRQAYCARKKVRTSASSGSLTAWPTPS